MSEFGRNLLREGLVFEGVGIHSGGQCRVSVSPAAAGSGCWIENAGERFPASLDSVIEVERATVLGRGQARVSTVEHLFSALSAFQVYDCTVSVEGAELPILDGSSLPYVEALQGKVEAAGAIEPIRVSQPLWVGDERSQVLALPAEEYRLQYALHYPHPLIGYQEVHFRPGQDSYIGELAPARTFALQQEVDWLRARGLAQGGSLDNALIIQDRGFSTPLRLAQEPARHKCLDLLGDLYLLGRPLQAHVIAVKAGHRWHVELARKIQSEVSRHVG